VSREVDTDTIYCACTGIVGVIEGERYRLPRGVVSTGRDSRTGFPRYGPDTRVHHGHDDGLKRARVYFAKPPCVIYCPACGRRIEMRPDPKEA
jgi:hypothetical protein